MRMTEAMPDILAGIPYTRADWEDILDEGIEDIHVRSVGRRIMLAYLLVGEPEM